MKNHPNMMQSQYEFIISDLHRIVESEYNSIELASPSKLKLVELLINVNSFGLLTKELADVLIDNYHSDKDFRRLWGSISIQFSFLLEMKYGFSTVEFAETITGFLDLENHPNTEVGSFTEASILEARIGKDGYAGAKLTSINDFWIICFFLTRLTMQESNLVKETLEKIHKEFNLAATQLAAMKDKFEKKSKADTVKITNTTPKPQ